MHSSTDELAVAFKEAFQSVIDNTKLPGDDLPSIGLSAMTTLPRGGSRVFALVAGFGVIIALGLATSFVLRTEPGPTLAEPQHQGSTDSANLTGLGQNGSYFAINDPSWPLSYAWEPDGPDNASFTLYENGNQQVSIITGAVAEEDLISMTEEAGGEELISNGVTITKYVWREGVSYTWRTSDQLSVVVTFGQMTEDEAEHAAALLQSIDAATFAEMIASSPYPPTTLVSAPDQ